MERTSQNCAKLEIFACDSRHSFRAAVVMGSFRASQIDEQQRRVRSPPVPADHQAHDRVGSAAVLVPEIEVMRDRVKVGVTVRVTVGYS